MADPRGAFAPTGVRAAFGSRVGIAMVAAGLIFGAGSMARSIAAESGNGPPHAEHVVTIEGMQFHPQTLTVKPGDRVTWVNGDIFPHTASAVSGSFDSRSIAADASWTYTAGKPGTYPYACQFHPGMAGTLIVVQ